jgi:sialate O-acetylesterase
MKSYLWTVFSVASGLWCGIGLLSADVKTPAIFGDHMVLQASTKLPVWGTATAGEKVTVTVGGTTGSATTGADGKWLVTLDPLKAGTAPVTMTIAGKNTLTYSDVLVGDVWICSGQSNMEFGLNSEWDAKDQIAQANLPLVHLFLVTHKTSLTPVTDTVPPMAPYLAGEWVVCTPENVVKVGGWNGFTAVGYFFGREIQKVTGQPVGLIETNWGGTPAQAWTSTEKLASDPVLKHYADTHAQNVANYPTALANFPAAQAKFTDDMAKWKSDNGLAPAATMTEINMASMKAKSARKPEAPQAPTAADGGQNAPSNLFDGMIAPLIPYGIKGAIWYQGESNAGAAAEYATLFPAMISDWRARWNEGDFPFLFVQLARYKDPNTGFALVRESQAKTLSLPNTGMAVAFDVGDQNDIHPKDKLDVGKRLALAAEHVAYGKDLVYSGPVYDKIRAEGGAIHVSFTQVGGGLIVGSAPWARRRRSRSRRHRWWASPSRAMTRRSTRPMRRSTATRWLLPARRCRSRSRCGTRLSTRRAISTTRTTCPLRLSAATIGKFRSSSPRRRHQHRPWPSKGISFGREKESSRGCLAGRIPGDGSHSLTDKATVF